MPAEPLELRPTIDRAWLEQVAATDPVTHAYALWDLDRLPEQVQFVSVRRGGEMLGYLLFWHGPRGATVVHWVAPPLAGIASALPPRPFLLSGPEEVRSIVQAARGPSVDQTVLVQTAPLGPVPAPTPADAQVRRLTREHVRALEALVRSSDDPMARSYQGLDPGPEVVFGAFDGETLAGVARASVRRPNVWIVSGVFVRPEYRRRGWGAAVTRAVMTEAARAGAPAALFVREDRADARRVYARLGFQPIGRRVLMECGTPAPG